MFAPKTDDLKDLGSNLLQVAKREKGREAKLRILLEKTVKMKRLVKEILVLLDKGSRSSKDKQRNAFAAKASKKMEELHELNETHQQACRAVSAIHPWGPTQFNPNTEFVFEKPQQ